MSDKKPRSAKRVLQVLGFAAVWLATLFGAAGRIDWLRGWIFVVLYSAGMAAAGAAIKRFNPGLIEARAKWRHKDTKRFDRVILAIYFPMTLVQPAVAGMDAVRFGWSRMPFWWVYVGAALFIPAFVLIAWTGSVNPFAEATVRIQAERGHKVVESGPYRFVRHPMYVGILVMCAAAPLVLGSLWALTVSAVVAMLFILRTALEDRALRRELPGYEDYAARTRYRLLPGVW